MRIIGGSARGRTLATPGDRRIRPTIDRVREALFSILGPLDDVVLVDAFAGSGALGCEALSRGAAHCTFIDRSRAAIELVRENLRRIDARDRATVIHDSFLETLDDLERDPDLWILDPPYDSDLDERALETMHRSPRVTLDTLVVLESRSTSAPTNLPPSFELEDERTYGDTHLIFVRRISTP